MCVGVAPFSSVHGMEVPAPEPMISRELIRSVCEPFFEQMITALQVALQEQQRRSRSNIPQTQPSTAHATRDIFQSVFGANMPGMHHRTQLDPMPDDESTTDEVGAFASLLSGPSSSEGEVLDSSEASPHDSEASSPLVHVPSPQEDSEPSDPEKSVMVCRHWRSKGWCRMEANCKFLHPENKRGVTAPKGSKACPSGACTSGTTLSLSDMIGLEGDAGSLALPRRKKRGGRGRSSKMQMEDVPILEPGQVLQTPTQSHSGENQP